MARIDGCLSRAVEGMGQGCQQLSGSCTDPARKPTPPLCFRMVVRGIYLVCVYLLPQMSCPRAHMCTLQHERVYGEQVPPASGYLWKQLEQSQSMIVHPRPLCTSRLNTYIYEARQKNGPRTQRWEPSIVQQPRGKRQGPASVPDLEESESYATAQGCSNTLVQRPTARTCL